jgi:hypothetical protein
VATAAYDQEQRGLIRLALVLAENESDRVRRALLMAMRVESSFHDLSYGDRDSEGVLQQRPSTGWGPASETAETDIKQFLTKARRLERQGFKGTAGQLAQAVQRSAFPDRYDQVAGEVAALLKGAAATVTASFGDYVSVGAGVDASKVSPNLLGRVWLLAAGTGRRIVLTSGWRDPTGPAPKPYAPGVPVADPEHSKHGKGLAVDAIDEETGKPIAEVIPERTLIAFGLRSGRSYNDLVHLEERSPKRYSDEWWKTAETSEAGVWQAAAVSSAIRLAPKLAKPARSMLGKVWGKLRGSKAAKVGAVGAGALTLNEILDGPFTPRGLVTAIGKLIGDPRTTLLVILLSLFAVALVFLGVLRLVGVRSNDVVNVVTGRG